MFLVAGAVRRASDAAIDALAAADSPRFESHVDWVPFQPFPPRRAAIPRQSRCGTINGTAVDVDFDTPLRTAGLLVVLDRFDSDWHAYVDGEKTPIVRTNGVFRGVVVPKGSRSVALRYERDRGPPRAMPCRGRSSVSRSSRSAGQPPVSYGGRRFDADRIAERRMDRRNGRLPKERIAELDALEHSVECVE